MEARYAAQRPEVVFLDVGDTLVRAHPSWGGVYLSVLHDFGIDVAPGDLDHALLEGAKTGIWDYEGPFEATEEASWKRITDYDRLVLASLGYPDLPEDVFHAIESAFAQRSAWHVFPDVPPALEALSAAGYRLAVISNWVWGAPELLHVLDLARHFEALTISARVGYQKPHPGIFRDALDRMRVAPERSVHVGDSYRADVQGATAVGIRPVLIDRHLQDGARLSTFPTGELPADLPVIRDLLELLDLLGVARPALSASA